MQYYDQYQVFIQMMTLAWPLTFKAEVKFNSAIVIENAYNNLEARKMMEFKNCNFMLFAGVPMAIQYM